MRRLTFGTLAAVAIVLGMSSAGSAASVYGLHEQGAMSEQAGNLHRVDYYWNHHHYHHRDWDRDHHRWHYYD